MNHYGVIMAGGGGTRFWPLSRQKTPKQLLNLSGKDLMVNEAVERIATVADKNDIFIVTADVQAEAMRNATSGKVLPENILAEPAARNTAACIGYAAMEIVRKHGDGVMIITPADHYIEDVPALTEIFRTAVKTAEEQDKFVTIGLKPTFPSTGFGYIKYDAETEGAVKPLGVRTWRPSKEEDWLLYAVHNPDYLKLKYKNGEKREKLPYTWQDIKASEGYDVEIAYIRALSYLEHTNANIIKRMREGARPLDLMEEGENAFLINQIVRAIQPSEIDRLQRENIELKREYKQLHDNYDVLMAAMLEWGFVVNYDNEGNVYLDDTKPYGIEGTQDYLEAP